MLNPIEEAKFANLKAICRELKVPAPPEIMIGLKVHDKNGLLIFDDVQRGHSWTRNFWNWLYSGAAHAPASGGSFAAGNLNLKRYDNVIDTSYAYLDSGGQKLKPYGGGIGVSGYGIQVGTSDTAFSVEQYTLQALIAHGTGSGQFSYTAETANASSYNGGTTTWKCTRYRIFNNNSGGSITVKEVGIMAYYWSGYYYLFERSVLDPTVPVANGAQLTVTYEISMDFAAID